MKNKLYPHPGGSGVWRALCEGRAGGQLSIAPLPSPAPQTWGGRDMAPYCGLASPQLLSQVLGVGYLTAHCVWAVGGCQQTKRGFLLRLKLQLSGRNTNFTHFTHKFHLILRSLLGWMGSTGEVHSSHSQGGSQIPLPCLPLGVHYECPDLWEQFQ